MNIIFHSVYNNSFALVFICRYNSAFHRFLKIQFTGKIHFCAEKTKKLILKATIDKFNCQ